MADWLIYKLKARWFYIAWRLSCRNASSVIPVKITPKRYCNSYHYINLPVLFHKSNQIFVNNPEKDEMHYAIDGYILYLELQSDLYMML